jgi:hypothetical protein
LLGKNAFVQIFAYGVRIDTRVVLLVVVIEALGEAIETRGKASDDKGELCKL